MTIHEALMDPNLRTLIVNATLGNAQDIMGEIRTHFETNEVFRWVFPEYCIDLCTDKKKVRMCKSTLDRIDFPCGNRMGKKEGNIECLGVEMSLVSKHYDLFIFDDLVNDVNTATSEYRNKVWRWFLNSWQLRHDPSKSRIRDIGTPWHLDDVHARIVNGEAARRRAGRSPKWLLYRRSVFEDTDDQNPSTTIWPERFTSSVLQDLRTELGSYIFSCQYLCNPISPENALFRPEQIKRIAEDDLPLSLTTFAAVDLATGSGDDYTVLVVASFDDESNMYVRQIIRGHIKPLELLDTLRSVDRIWRPRRVGIETVGFQHSVLDFYKDYSRNERFSIPWVEMKRGIQHKSKRFLGMQPMVESGMFYVVDGIENFEALWSEMTTVTMDHMPTHDDILDCLADLQKIAYTTHEAVEEEKPPSNSIDGMLGPLGAEPVRGYSETSFIRSSWR
jgi:hypothetical protein